MALSQRGAGLLHPVGQPSLTPQQLPVSPDFQTRQDTFPSRAELLPLLLGNSRLASCPLKLTSAHV